MTKIKPQTLYDGTLICLYLSKLYIVQEFQHISDKYAYRIFCLVFCMSAAS